MTDTITVEQAREELKCWVVDVHRNMHKPPEERWAPTFEECKGVAKAIDVYLAAMDKLISSAKRLVDSRVAFLEYQRNLRMRSKPSRKELK